MIDVMVFYAAAALAVGAALVVVLQGSPTTSAFALIVTLCSLSVVYGLLGSPFIAILQVVVYAGAIMVLFLFVLMLLDVKREEPRPGLTPLRGAAAALCALLVLQLGTVLLAAPRGPAPAGYDASTRAMARLLFSPHFLYVFEASSILILAALVGAVLLARKDAP